MAETIVCARSAISSPPRDRFWVRVRVRIRVRVRVRVRVGG